MANMQHLDSNQKKNPLNLSNEYPTGRAVRLLKPISGVAVTGDLLHREVNKYF